MKERRKFNRLESKDKAILHQAEGKSEESRLLDVSPGGMRILLDKEINVGCVISGQFKIIPHIGHFYVKGDVVWVKPSGPKTRSQTFEAGIKFSKVSAVSL